MDIILDTGHFADFLAQYFSVSYANRGSGEFAAEGLISQELARRLNNIMMSSREGILNLVITSAFSFVELVRKWPSLSNNRFEISQLHSFIQQPPEWFSIAPIDCDLLPSFIDVPPVVLVDNKPERIEWTDALHMAIVISRSESVGDATLVTTDRRLNALLKYQRRLIID